MDFIAMKVTCFCASQTMIYLSCVPEEMNSHRKDLQPTRRL